MRFRVLGPLELVDGDGAARPVGSPSQRRLLAALLARSPEVVAVDVLVDAVWGDDPPETAVATLRTHVSRLRSLVGDALTTKGSGYQLLTGPRDTDASLFELLAREAAGIPPARAVVLLDEALDLWRGPAYGEEADGACVRPEARRLDERRSQVAESRARLLLEAGREPEAVAAAEALVAGEPLREGAWAVLVEGLARTDRAAEALRAFQRAAAVLADAGLQPSPGLRRAEQAVLGGEFDRQPAPSAPDPDRPAVPAPPLVASSFIGRDTDREQLTDLLDGARVVTLVGPGGVGKTRLALEVARAAAPRRGLGVRIVELARLADGDDVAAAVVAELGLAGEQASSHDALRRAGHLDVLVVLDNAEHVIGDAARAVDLLVQGGAAIRVLTTSRERLGVDGEHVWTVSPLTGAGANAPGCQLFVERARAVVNGLDVRADDELVGRIVRRLDGLPLAIEMAAAQLSASSLAELADALDERVDALRSPRRDVAERHRSLAAVLAWSEERLDDDEAALLAELSVFAGPVSALDIVGVLGRDDSAELARSLAARSLVSVDRSASPARFQLLFTVRDFARRKLMANGRDEELADRHAAWFLDVVAEADRQLRTPAARAAHDRIEGIFAEVRAAHRWARRNDPSRAIALSEHLQLFAYTRLVDEPLQWAESLAESRAGTGTSGDEAPALLTAVATRALTRGDLRLATSLARRAADLAGPTPARLSALEVMADAAVYDGRLADCIQINGDLHRLAVELGDAHYAVLGRCGAIMAAAYREPPAGPAEAVAEIEALAGGHELPPAARGWLAYTLGELVAEADPSRAYAAYDQALALAEDCGDRLLGGVALVSSCSLRARVGDLGRSLSSFADAIRHWERLADRTHQLTTLRNLAVLLERADEPAAAAELLGAVDRTDVPTYGEEAARLEAVRLWTHERLGAERAGQLAALGSTRDVSAAATWALELVSTLELASAGAGSADAPSVGQGAEA